jgi:hypothetical protein
MPVRDPLLYLCVDQGESTWSELSALAAERYLAYVLQSQPSLGILESLLASAYTEAALPEAEAGPAESVEMRWLLENSRALERYRGEWLLLRGNELLAHSGTFADLENLVRDLRIESPFVYYVPTEEESNFIACLS